MSRGTVRSELSVPESRADVTWQCEVWALCSRIQSWCHVALWGLSSLFQNPELMSRGIVRSELSVPESRADVTWHCEVWVHCCHMHQKHPLSTTLRERDPSRTADSYSPVQNSLSITLFTNSHQLKHRTSSQICQTKINETLLYLMILSERLWKVVSSGMWYRPVR
jgi:hypothetical protein